MKRTVVVTDSNATVPADLARDLDIRIVPIVLAIDGYIFLDGVDITPADVYRLLRESQHLPTTSAPSIGDFLRVYAAASQEASAIVSIHLSPKLSATYSSATAASRMVDDVPIRVLNCHTAAMGQGFVAIEAARAAASGASLEDVVARAEEVAAKINLIATIGTLEYLHRGGRIGSAATLLGTVLQIKPVLRLSGGQVEVFARPRTKSRAVKVMLKHMADQVNNHPVRVAILHAGIPEEAEELRQRIVQEFNCDELYVTELTPVMGAHTGPGVLGIVFYKV
jgi:DegV family protein with EDD domain